MDYTKTNWVENVTKVGPTNLNKIEQALSDLTGLIAQGTAAARPAATAANKNQAYYSTDTGSLHININGSTWTQLLGPPDAIIQPLNGAFSNTYVNYTPTNPFHYWKDSSGFVHIAGEINTSGVGINAAGTIITQLLPGYRPAGRYLFKGSTNTSPYVNHYELGADGNLKVDSNGANPASYANFGHTMIPTF